MILNKLDSYTYNSKALIAMLSLLPISFTIYARQVPCNPSCSDTTGGYISEKGSNEKMLINNVYLNGTSPESNIDNYPNVTVGFGNRLDTSSSENLNLDAKSLIISTKAPLAYHTRGIVLATYNSNAELTATISDSSVMLSSNNQSSSYNTIGILMESLSGGQIYNINLNNVDLAINSVAVDNIAGGIWTNSNDGFAETNISLNKTSLEVTSDLSIAYGIRTENSPGNSQNSVITIQDITAGSIYVNGYTAAYGISIDTEGKSAYIDNKSAIEVIATGENSKAYGINTQTQESTINTQAKSIIVSGVSEAYGINSAGVGNQTISNGAEIRVKSSERAVGIQSLIGNGNIFTNGNILVRGDGETFGILADSQGDSTVNVASSIDAGNRNGIGIYSATTTGANSINLHSGSNVIGGMEADSSGIFMSTLSGMQLLNLAEGSKISSLNDLAISIKSNHGDTTINNNGQIIGYVTIPSGDSVVFNNKINGIIDLKNFSNGTKNSIVYNIGAIDSIFNNEGLVRFADDNFDGSTTNTTFNVASFINSGLIDLTGKNPSGTNDLVGDTFTINGNYISNGGSIYLNTVLDNAISNAGQGISDLVIINGNASTGAGGATNVYITPTAKTTNLGDLTIGNGIKIIDITGTSSKDAFKLGSPVVAGAYEYTLGQGKADDSWYLSSYKKESNDIIQYNPAIGAYLGNQTAAVQMFQQTLFDRLISSSVADNSDASQSIFWIRTKMSHGSYNSVHGQLSNRNRSDTLQIGNDLYVWTLHNGGYIHLGMMGGYGDAKNRNRSDSTGTKTEGKVKGYTVGLYGTYFANQDTSLGLYLDLWSQMGWYRNEITGKAQIGSKKYNSTVWSNSIESGYGISIVTNSEYQLLATPQVQLTYNNYDTDNQYDRNKLYVTNNNASGLDSRLGVRFHAKGIKKELLEPFLEVNWLNTTAKNKLNFNGKSHKDGFAKDRFETKIGLQGNISKNWSVSAQVGGQWGKNSYNSYQGQLNLNYKF